MGLVTTRELIRELLRKAIIKMMQKYAEEDNKKT